MSVTYECIIVFISLLSINFITTTELTTTYNSESILCRSCGTVITSSTHIISKQSPLSTYSVYDTLFGQSNVLVQVLSDTLLLQFPVITFLHTSCVVIEEYGGETTWFPGYIGNPCICPECGAYVGWIFMPINNDITKPHQSFYALILINIIDQTCNYEIQIILNCDCPSSFIESKHHDCYIFNYNQIIVIVFMLVTVCGKISDLFWLPANFFK